MTPYQRIEPFLSAVRKPSRYTGGEFQSVMKDLSGIDLRACFCFPDTYEIGMSCLGMRILYDCLNRLPTVWCERSFAPWEDMRALLKRKNIPLYALESGDSLRDFDVLAFTLQYELSYTNVLMMLDLAGIPLRSSERDETFPFVIAGGPCAFHPEPIADFIDLFAVGEGEEVIVEVTELFRAAKKERLSRKETLERASRISGVYVPSLYNIRYNEDGTIASINPENGAPSVVHKRIIEDLNGVAYPDNPIAASTEIVHDRVMLELFRGCTRGCRFCQAGHTTRPVREKSPSVLAGQAQKAVLSSGLSEIGLVSLSTSDYSGLEALCDSLVPWCSPRRVSLSLPSLRADSFHMGLLKKTGQVRKSGLTFAPEAGSERLRNVINKNLTENDLYNACKTAFVGGWSGVKLYFMLGLPTETDDDVRSIAELCGKVYALWRQTVPDKGRSVRITASASCFVPKPHTPFQWEAMTAPGELRRRAELVRGSMRKQVSFNWHEPDASYLECVLSRGDRRLGIVLERAYKAGCRMDGWSECFSLERWLEAFSAEGIDPDFYALRERALNEILPWSHISCGVTQEHFKREREKAYRAQTSSDCRGGCEGCGIGCGKKEAFSAETAVPLAPAVRTESALPAPLSVRLAYHKTGRARFISHLDTMSVFHGALTRAGLPLRYTEGFNPHIVLSIALPLGVGIESVTERLDFGITGNISFVSLPARLNAVLPEGFFVTNAAAGGRPVPQIAFARYDVITDSQAPPDSVVKLFTTSAVVDKRNKKKQFIPTDIVPFIRDIKHAGVCRDFNPFGGQNGGTTLYRFTLFANNPILNPEYIATAWQTYLDPEAAFFFRRTALLDTSGNPFDSFA